MPKNFYCAQCGTELRLFRKFVNSQSRIVNLVEFHTCIEIVDDTPTDPKLLVLTEKPKSMPIDISKLFDDFKFVQKLNNLDEKAEVHRENHGDKRSKEHLRRELISTAPEELLNRIKPSAKTRPDYVPEGESEPDEDET